MYKLVKMSDYPDWKVSIIETADGEKIPISVSKIGLMLLRQRLFTSGIIEKLNKASAGCSLLSALVTGLQFICSQRFHT